MEKEKCRPDNKKEKTVDEALSQLYLTAEDLMIIIPNLKIDKARNYINDIRKEMEKQKLFIPKTRTKLALTSLVKKKFGF